MLISLLSIKAGWATRGRRLVVGITALLCLLSGLAPAVARAQAASARPQPITQPLALLRSADAEREVLTITGPEGPKVLTLGQLERLPMYRVQTSTFWPDDDGVYEGPLLSEVLRRHGLDKRGAVRARAADGFSQRLPREDWERWPVMLATRRDGQLMGPRDKGPLRLIYPRDMDKVLLEPVYRLRWVWLLTHVDAAPER